LSNEPYLLIIELWLMAEKNTYGWYRDEATNEERLELIRRKVGTLNEDLQDEDWVEGILENRRFPRVQTSNTIFWLREVFAMLTWEDEEE